MTLLTCNWFFSIEKNCKISKYKKNTRIKKTQDSCVFVQPNPEVCGSKPAGTRLPKSINCQLTSQIAASPVAFCITFSVCRPKKKQTFVRIISHSAPYVYQSIKIITPLVLDIAEMCIYQIKDYHTPIP
jgi:hypothetical protein